MAYLPLQHYYENIEINPYMSADGPGYGLSGVMGSER